jgi:hypothetical protein
MPLRPKEVVWTLQPQSFKLQLEASTAQHRFAEVQLTDRYHTDDRNKYILNSCHF